MTEKFVFRVVPGVLKGPVGSVAAQISSSRLPKALYVITYSSICRKPEEESDVLSERRIGLIKA